MHQHLATAVLGLLYKPNAQFKVLLDVGACRIVVCQVTVVSAWSPTECQPDCTEAHTHTHTHTHTHIHTHTHTHTYTHTWWRHHEVFELCTANGFHNHYYSADPTSNETA
jgi:hypothetical protein